MWADYDSSLPIRSESDGADERVHVKIVDGSSGAVNQATVDSDKNLHIECHGNRADDTADIVLTLSELGYANTDGVYEADDNSDPGNIGLIGHVRNATPGDTHQTIRWTGVNGTTATTVWAMDVSLHDEDGNPYSDSNPLFVAIDSDNNTVDVSIDGVYNVSTNADPDNIGLIAHTRATTPADAQQTLRLTGVNGTADDTVWALDVALHDGDGDAYTESNPLPVSFEESGGVEVHDYDTGAAIVKDATDDHDYSVANGDVFYLRQIWASASGKLKIEVQIGDGGASEIFTTKFVGFNSTADPNISIDFGRDPLKVTGTVNTTTVKIIRTNLDNQAQDVYSTIIGDTH